MAEYKKGSESFINPYNFISITPNITRGSATDNKEIKHTGFLECKLTTKTPIAIPDTDSKEEDKEIKDHYYYPAFRIGDKLAIPGSSIRGTLRSVYETLTNSCMSTIDGDQHITKRTDLGTFRPCVLKGTVDLENKIFWSLYDAVRIPLVGSTDSSPSYKQLNGDHIKHKVNMDETGKYICIRDEDEKIRWGDAVQITQNGPGHKKYNKKTGTRKEVWGGKSVDSIKISLNDTNCYLYLGEMIENKHAESVFRITEKTKIKSEEIAKALKGLEETLSLYRDGSVNRNYESTHFGYKGYEYAKKKMCIPLWYKHEGGMLYLSLAAIGRIVFNTNIKVLSVDHSACTDRKELCPACSIWGMIGRNKGSEGYGSRIRITDAKIISDGNCSEDVTLKELGAPKKSYLQFYSKEMKGFDENGAQIRGRKYYWHNPVAANSKDEYSTKTKTNRNGTLEVVKPDQQFVFTIYYDGISTDQLKLLKWIITIGGNSTNLMHKIGHGKPLGLGSVKITITRQVERKLTEEYKLSKEDVFEFEKAENIKLLDQQAWDEFKIISSFNESSKDIIRYPYVILSEEAKSTVEEKARDGYTLKENVLASHQWFKVNKDVLPNIKEGRVNKHMIMEANLADKDFENKNKQKSSKDTQGDSHNIKTVIIKRISKKGTLIFDDGQNEGNVIVGDNDERKFREGEEIKVIFKNKKEFDGKTVAFYKLVN